jgi:hypothetical protein
MDITTITDQIKRVPISSCISLCALAISVISLYVSLRKLDRERKMDSAKKRTELMNRLSDAKRNLETSLSYCKLPRPASKECKDRWQAHLPGIESIIKKIGATYQKLDQYGHNIDPLKLETMTPEIYEVLKVSEDSRSELKELLEMCLSCPSSRIELPK